MGGTYDVSPVTLQPYKHKILLNGEIYHFENDGINQIVKYDTDWNWLIPVVEKIEGLGFEFNIKLDAAWINRTYYRANFPLVSFICDTKLESVYAAVTQFITFYNERI